MLLGRGAIGREEEAKDRGRDQEEVRRKRSEGTRRKRFLRGFLHSCLQGGQLSQCL